MVTPISQITVYSNASTLGSTLVQVGTFPVDNSSQRSATLRGEDSVKLCFKSGTRIDIPAFSFIEYEGQIFFTKELYRPLVKGGYYEYSVKFVSFDNMLSKPQAYRHVVVDNEEWNEPEMDLNGDLQAIAEVVLGSITSCSSRYEGVFAYLLSHVELGTVKQGTQSKTFNFSEQKVSQVLEAIANDYEIDYWFEQVGNIGSGISKMKLHFCKLERTDRDMLVVSDEIATTDDPKHPTQSLGLKECSFANEWSGVVHRLTPYGSDRNMKRQQAIVNDMYVSFGKRLRLQYDHSCTINGTTYQHAYAIKNEDGETEPLYVDENNAITIPGVTTGEESVEKYEDIYPRGHFRVTHVTQRGTEKPIYTVYAIPTEEHNGVYTDLTDAQIDAMQADETKRLFPIQIAEGQTLSLHFESGFLNGREFEVANKSAVMKWEGDAYKVDPANGHWVACFEIEPTGDNNESPQVPFGTLVPRGKFDEQVYEGDIFAIFNMDMPAYYVESAQNELAQAAYDKMVGILSTRPEVKCRGNETFFSTHDMFLGQRVQVTSELFGSTVFVSRVTSFSHSLSKPNDVDFRLCSSRVQGSISMMKAAISDQTSSIQGVQQTARSISRRAFRDVAEMKDMLESVTAEMMVVGVEKNQFVFTMGIECLEATTSTLTRKFDGLQITAGEIQHSQDAYIKEAFNGKYIVDACTLRTDVLGGYIDKNADQTHRETPYYLYAHINTTTGKATMELHSGKKDDTSPESDHDYLLLGILSSEFPDGTESLRVFNRSNGFTSIAGGTITTEQIQDPTRQLIIDMSSNPPRIIARNGAEIIGNIRFISSSGQQRTVEDYIDDALDGYDFSFEGGRNLLRDTAFSKYAAQLIGWTFYNASTTPSSGKDINGGSMRTHSDDSTNIAEGELEIFVTGNNRILLTQTAAAGYNAVGDSYMLSALVKAETATTLYFAAGFSSYPGGYGSAAVGTSYTKIEIPAIVVSTGGSSSYAAFFMRLATDEENTLIFKQVMLEKGSKASPWLPAPEDTAAEIAENRNYIGTIQEDLQKQIDGVVDSYFMEGVPTMDDTKKPLSDWKTEGGGTIDYAKHEGDTYTNIKNYGDELNAEEWEQGRVYYGENYIGKTLDESKSPSTDSNHAKGVRFSRLIQYKAGDSMWLNTNNGAYDILIVYFDNQGKQAVQNYYAGSSYASVVEIALNSSYTKFSVSIRSTSAITTSIVPELAICVNPKAGHSWRFCKGTGENPATWHWHEIADSDAVKALQDAAAAQDTADGKRRCFVSQPVPPYDPGDLWANATYSGDGVEYDNVLLKCKAGCGKTKNQSFAISDWEDSSRAISAADTAQAAADDAMQKAEDIANDGIISGGTEKATLKKEWQEIAGDNMLHNTNGSYKKALDQASEYGITSGTEITNINTAYATLENAMKVIVGYNPESTPVWTDTNMHIDTYLMNSDGTQPERPSGTNYLAYTRDGFAAIWRAYYDAEIALLNLVSDTIDTKEIGGENLYTKEDPLSIGGNFTYRLGNVEAGKTYVLSIGSKTGAGTVPIQVSDSSFSQTMTLGEIPTEAFSTRWHIVLKPTISGILYLFANYASHTLTNIMLQEGDKPTTYQSSYKFLAEAFEHDATKLTTSIDGGLIISALMKMINQSNAVTAGLSGLNDGLILWGGGTYAQALSDVLGTTDILPVLLSSDPDGVGSKIGIFKIKKDDDGNRYIQVDHNGTPSLLFYNNLTSATCISNNSPTTSYPSSSQQSTSTIKVQGYYNRSTSIWTYYHYLNGDLVGTYTNTNAGKSLSDTKVLLNTSKDLVPATYKFGATVTFAPSINANKTGDELYQASASASITLKLTITNVYTGEVVGTQSFSTTDSQPYYKNFTISKQFDINSAGSYQIKLEAVLSIGAYSVNQSNHPPYDITGTGLYGEAQGKVTFTGATLTNLSSRTILCKDGFLFMSGGSNFTLRQSVTGLDARMNGLPTSDPNVKGQLYTQNMTINGTSQKVLCVSTG